VFVSAVYPDCKDDACNKQHDEDLKKSKVKAKIFSRLFYRHWNAFTEFKRSHLFVVNAEAQGDRSTDVPSVGPAGVSPAGSQTPNKMSGDPTGEMPVLQPPDLTAGDRKSGVSPDSAPGRLDQRTPDGQAGRLPAETSETHVFQPRDLTPGDHDVPPFSLGGQDMYAISPDGKEVAYTSNIDEGEATSTNNEIFVVPISGPATAGKKISTSPGADTTPLYSPDGKYLAWRSQARAGFEADKWRLLVQDRQSGESRDLTEKFDRSVGSFTWMSGVQPGGIFVAAEDYGQSPIYAFILGQEGPMSIEEDTESGPLHADDLVWNHDQIYFTRMSIDSPNEIWRVDLSTAVLGGPMPVHAVTRMNDELLSQIDMQPLESFTFKGANNEDVQGFMVKPPGFDPNKKYPLKFLIHGGPQGAWGNEWSYRWNAELFAATGNSESVPEPSGYVVVMINFHGSTGYGQKFTDSISGDWGGKPYVDLMKGLDYMEKTYPFIDKNREAALGASYGGYMANWLLGHTDRFKCIVSHDGMFNAESAYGTTEELWFPNWEFGGPPWKKRHVYRKWSPHEYAAHFKTPTLVVHGQNDYRIDVSQGFDLFTTLQVLKVPSKMLYFPDEGHWVLKPQN
jgi:dipeptidyl aminopeptidase/acylaminoacyl peptidase